MNEVVSFSLSGSMWKLCESVISRAQDSGTVEGQCKREGRSRRQKGNTVGPWPFCPWVGLAARDTRSVLLQADTSLLVQPLWFL